jgi:O-antigen/teichoic acid export membrane protein
VRTAAGDRSSWYTNWLAFVGIVLVASMAVSLPVAAALGLGGWMLAGVAANLLGVATLETYREVQRGLGGYGAQAAHYVLANLLQLGAIVLAAAAGWRSPALFIVAYGLSSPVALAAVLAVRPVRLRLRRTALDRARLLEIARFVRPLLLESVLYAIWFSGDLVLVERLLGPAEAGVYAAAKAVANAFALVPLAISFTYLPRVAGLAEERLAGSLVRALGLTAAATLPLVLGVAVLARPLSAGVFGARYAAAAGPLTVLVAGMAVYAFRGPLAGLWIGIGRPVVAAASCGAGTVCLVAAGLTLVPRWGLMGAAAAFSLGAVAQVAVAGAATVWALTGVRVRHAGERPPPPLTLRESKEPR